MKNKPIIYIILSLFLMGAFTTSANDLKLWYEHPAREWVESLPIGNGRLLATNTGGVRHEVVQLNDDTLWGGKAEDKDNPEGAKYLGKIRSLLFNGEYKKAEKLVNEKMMTPHHAHGVHAYQTLGDLHLYFDYDNSRLEPENYTRELSLDRAISKVNYQIGGTGYTRELFSSAADQAVVIRLTSDKENGLNFDAVYKRPGAVVKTLSDSLIQISGQATDKGNPNSGGSKYEVQIQVLASDGNISPIENGLRISNAGSVELRIVSATDYYGEDPHDKNRKQINVIQNKTYEALKSAHIAEHQRLFNRVSLELPLTKKIRRMGPTVVKNLPTDQRIEVFRQGIPDPELIALYFQFGRYMLITCSRPGTQAINLWGKWINTIDPWYNADYHTNINIQMNYWPAQSCNLAECNTPFFDLIDELRPNGRISAQKTYGAKGFVAHHATDGWRFTAAVGRPTHGMWVMTPAWGAHQMWQHYLFNLDKEYLKNKSYPVMKEAAEFFVDYLVEDPETGYLVTGPATSPENTFLTPSGAQSSQSMGPTMDMQFVHDLFANTIDASQVLKVDRAFRKKLEKMKAKLLPMQIGEDGRLMEWAKPFKEVEPGHKHVAHLWGACEGDLITPAETPALAAAALKSLDFRVDHGSAQTPVFRGNTGWIVQSYARLLKGDQAYDILKYMIGQSSYPNLFAISVQGISRKMWETDANLGCTSAIAEMLLQSHAGSVHILPALPKALPDGEVKGLRARGAFEVDMKWSNGALDAVTIKSLKGELCKLKYGDKEIEFRTEVGKEYCLNSSLRISNSK